MREILTFFIITLPRWIDSFYEKDDYVSDSCLANIHRMTRSKDND